MTSPTVRRRQLASALRRMRKCAGVTLEAAAEELEVSAATLSRMETGSRLPRARDVRDLGNLYGADADEIARLTDLAQGAREGTWWDEYAVDETFARYLGHEAAASRIEQFEACSVPGLLQTEEYARAFYTDVVAPARGAPFTARDLAKRVTVRLRRQRTVHEDRKVDYTALLDEAALRRPVGGTAVMRGQLEHLRAMAGRPHVHVRIIPFAHGPHPGQAAAGFTVFTLPKDVSDVAFVESPAGQQFHEDDDEIERCRRVFAALREAAAPKSRTKAVLAQLAADCS